MKRYWVFMGEDYYPQPRFEDFEKSFDSKEDATTFCTTHLGTKIGGFSYVEWAHVVDVESETIVYNTELRNE